jgi:hypothetical protein
MKEVTSNELKLKYCSGPSCSMLTRERTLHVTSIHVAHVVVLNAPVAFCYHDIRDIPLSSARFATV